jgi:cupin fold WbuC family metalloprotein
LKDVVYKGSILARHITESDINKGLTFFTEESDYLQVGAWRYEKGKRLLPHIHNLVRRESDRTQECVVVVKGCIRVTIYDEEGRFLERISVNAGEAVILLAGGHDYEIADNDSIVFEVKNGPYPGAEIDRKRIDFNG